MSEKNIKICVLVPAYNEEGNIFYLAQKLKQWKNIDPSNRKILVVNDGSSDNTKELLSQFDFLEVIDSSRVSKNVGKAKAFVAGVKHLAKYDPDVLVTLDADLIDLKPESIDFMVKKLVDSGYYMVVGNVVEGKNCSHVQFSGQRAIKFFALNPILVNNTKWLSLLERGYGLETALNYLIPRKKQLFLSKILFLAREPFEKSGPRQTREITDTESAIVNRKFVAEQLKGLPKPIRKFAATVYKNRFRMR